MNHQLKFKNMRTGDKVFDIVNYTLLTLIMVIVLYPVLYIVAASFSDPQAVVSGEVFILPVRPTLRGYEAVFKNKKILTGFANSVYYLVVGTLLNLVMTVLIRFPEKSFVPEAELPCSSYLPCISAADWYRPISW